MLELLDDFAPEYDSEKEEEWALFVQDNVNYYIPVFDKFDQTGEYAHFNLAAALGGFFWATYRKMYLVAFFQVVLVLFLSNLFGGLLYVAGFLIYGFFGNWFYYKHCTKKIEAIKYRNIGKGVRNTRLGNKGGVSLIVPLGIIIAIVAFFAIIIILLNDAF